MRPVATAPAHCLRHSCTVLLVIAIAVGMSACTRHLDADVLQQSIASGLEEQLALPVASVQCPADHPIRSGDTFECTATPREGGQLAVAVTQTDDQGNINWKIARTDGLMDLQLVETSVAEGLRTQADVEATVSCGGRWKAIRPGEEFSCEAQPATGEAVTVKVTTSDADGNISWTVG
jgi:hypothetical protein